MRELNNQCQIVGHVPTPEFDNLRNYLRVEGRANDDDLGVFYAEPGLPLNKFTLCSGESAFLHWTPPVAGREYEIEKLTCQGTVAWLVESAWSRPEGWRGSYCKKRCFPVVVNREKFFSYCASRA